MNKNKNKKIIKKNIEKTDEQRQKYQKAQKNKYHNMTDE